MVGCTYSCIPRLIPLLIGVCFVSFPVQAKYGGGTGTTDDPYLIYTAEHLNAVGLHEDDWDKHFKLIADISLSGFLHDVAVIAPDTNSVEQYYQGIPFTGVLDGDGHTISHLTITGEDYLGLFGRLGPGANVSNLGLEAADVHGSGDYVGGLAGYNDASITNCYSTGTVTGGRNVGGIVGGNWGVITDCNSSATVLARQSAGGLVGSNHAALGPPIGYPPPPFLWLGSVSTYHDVIDLEGWDNGGSITNCYAAGRVEGDRRVGGLLGSNGKYVGATVANCYSTGFVWGHSDVGGLVGKVIAGPVACSFWDIETSGQANSAGGIGTTTAKMKTASTFLEAGWDFINIWDIGENQTYPFLRFAPAGDLNRDKHVDFGDLGVFAQHWLEDTGP